MPGGVLRTPRMARCLLFAIFAPCSAAVLFGRHLLSLPPAATAASASFDLPDVPSYLDSIGIPAARTGSADSAKRRADTSSAPSRPAWPREWTATVTVVNATTRVPVQAVVQYSTSRNGTVAALHPIPGGAAWVDIVEVGGEDEGAGDGRFGTGYQVIIPAPSTSSSLRARRRRKEQQQEEPAAAGAVSCSSYPILGPMSRPPVESYVYNGTAVVRDDPAHIWISPPYAFVVSERGGSYPIAFVDAAAGAAFVWSNFLLVSADAWPISAFQRPSACELPASLASG